MSPVVRTLGKALKADTHLWYPSSRKQNPEWHAACMAFCSLANATAGHLNRVMYGTLLYLTEGLWDSEVSHHQSPEYLT